MEKTTRKLNDLLSQFLSLRNEVSEIADNKLLPVANWICLPDFSPARLMFKALKNYLEEQKFEIFLVTPECYTIRAKFPEVSRCSRLCNG